MMDTGTEVLLKARNDKWAEIVSKAIALDQLLADIKADVVKIVQVEPSGTMKAFGTDKVYTEMIEAAPEYTPLKEWIAPQNPP